MKLIRLLPPVVALCVVGTWIGVQRRSLAAVEQENTLLQKHIAAVRSGAGAADPARAKAVAADKTAKDKRFDWKKIAEQFSEMQRGGGMGDMRTMLRLQQRLQAMSQQELIAALDEIAGLDLPAASRAMLEQLVMGPLSQKDPELALNRFLDRQQDDQHGMMSWQLANAFQEWAKKDPAKAGFWFDAQIAAGKFESKALDGKSQSRMQFDGNLIGVLLASDAGAAARRLAAIPEDQRAAVIRNYAYNLLKEADQVALAKLVREQVPAKEQAALLSQQASRLVHDGYAKVTEYLARIEATPAERSACVEQSAITKMSSNGKKLAVEDLDAMREWVGSQAPAVTGSVTGKVLANATQGGRQLEFAAAAELAVQYNQSGGSDEVLGTFLESWPAREHKDEARLLAARITDEKRREKILKNLR